MWLNIIFGNILELRAGGAEWKNLSGTCGNDSNME